jgi:hypothetical protein
MTDEQPHADWYKASACPDPGDPNLAVVVQVSFWNARIYGQCRQLVLRIFEAVRLLGLEKKRGLSSFHVWVIWKKFKKCTAIWSSRLLLSRCCVWLNVCLLDSRWRTTEAMECMPVTVSYLIMNLPYVGRPLLLARFARAARSFGSSG